MNISTSLMTNIIILMNERKYYTIICSFSCENEQMYFHFIVKYKANENEFSHSKKNTAQNFLVALFCLLSDDMSITRTVDPKWWCSTTILQWQYTLISYMIALEYNTHIWCFMPDFFPNLLFWFWKLSQKFFTKYYEIFFELKWNSAHTNSRAV